MKRSGLTPAVSFSGRASTLDPALSRAWRVALIMQLIYTDRKAAALRSWQTQLRQGDFTMADEIKKITVRIGGMSYHLVSAEDEKYTRQIAARADEMIRRVMAGNPQLSQNTSAILALINALDELARIRLQFGSLDDQRQLHERQMAETRSELSRMREQNWDMKKEILRLNSICKDYEQLLQKAVPPPQAKEQPRGILVEDADDTVYTETEDDRAIQPEDPVPDQPVDDLSSQRPLTQTNLEDYLRDNGWPQPIETRHYDNRPD
jgi:cell division protein ZapA (FtsZ GTPase activity inhibitor)